MLGIEMNLSLLEQDLDVIDRNLKYLNQIKNDLLFNIKLHKSGRVITMITEYRKSIEELKSVEKEIINCKNNQISIKQKLNIQQQSHDKYMKEFEQLYTPAVNDGIVLPFSRK